MADQDIATEWKGFDDAKRTRLLAKMTPDQKKSLRAAIEGGGTAPSTPSAPPTATVNTQATPQTLKAQFQQLMQPTPSSETHPGFVGGMMDMFATPTVNVLKRAASFMVGVPSGIAETAGAIFNPDLLSSDEAKSRAAEQRLLAQHPGAQIADRIQEFRNETKTDPAVAVENLAGDAAGMYLTDKAVSGVKAIPKAVGKVGRGTVETITDTSPESVANFVKQTSQDNAEKIEAARDKTAAQNEAHARKVRDTEALNKAKQDKYEADLAAHQAAADEVEKAAAETGTQRGELARKTKQGAARLVQRVQTVAKATKASLDNSYSQIREATAGQSVPGETVRGAVEAAQNSLAGSDESIKQFKDILRKTEDTEPDTIPYQGAEIPKGHPLYDVLAEGIEPAEPMTFKDLQGYYSELGEKLAGGDLPGDVYKAMRSLQDSIGTMMQQMAVKAGKGAQFKATQARYADYMQTFKEQAGPNHSGSPIAMSLKAKDPTYAIKPLTEEATAQRVRNMLTRFDPPVNGQGGAGALYDNFMKDTRAFKALPKEGSTVTAKAPPKAPVLKPPPEAPAPVKAKVNNLDQSKIESEKARNIQKSAGFFRNRTKYVAVRAASVMAPFAAATALTGHLSGAGIELLAIPAAAVGTKMLANMLDRPAITEWLGKMNERDAAAINALPPKDRAAVGNRLKLIVEAAQEKGLKVDPAILALIAQSGANGINNRKDAMQLLATTSSK